MKIRLVKEGGALAPYDSESEEWVNAQIQGKYFEADLTSPRNNQFHKKFFALLNATYPHWKPLEVGGSHGTLQVAEKSMAQYREDITILAGFYEQAIRLDGSVRTRAKSISFAKMSEAEFSLLYDKVISVILRKVLIGWTIEQVDDLVGGFF